MTLWKRQTWTKSPNQNNCTPPHTQARQSECRRVKWTRQTEGRERQWNQHKARAKPNKAGERQAVAWSISQAEVDIFWLVKLPVGLCVEIWLVQIFFDSSFSLGKNTVKPLYAMWSTSPLLENKCFPQALRKMLPCGCIPYNTSVQWFLLQIFF